MKHVLVIGGSDTTGVAGIQGDLKALASISHKGIHGVSAVTSITSQNTQSVTGVMPLAADEVLKQIEAIFSDIEVSAVKTGMLFSSDIAEAIASSINDFKGPIVVDPVISSTVGAALSKSDLIEAMRQKLLPLATVITPNIDEARALAPACAVDEAGPEKLCEELHELGARNIVLKGGHGAGSQSIDLFFDGSEYHEFSLPRIETRPVHGTGCAFASHIAAELATGASIFGAVKSSKEYVYEGILHAYPIGEGVLAFSHNAAAERERARYLIIRELRQAMISLEKILPASFVAEVGMNFCYALPNAKDIHDVAGLEPRITTLRGAPHIPHGVDFGASSHVARIVLAAMSFDGAMRSAANVRYSQEALAACNGADFSAASFSRENEPEGVGTMEWGTLEAIKSNNGVVPDIIYDLGSVGKEPMIRVIGKAPSDVVEKIRRMDELLAA